MTTTRKNQDTMSTQKPEHPLIHLEHISKVYDTADHPPYQALQDVSLEIDRGEFVGIIGNSVRSPHNLFSTEQLLILIWGWDADAEVNAVWTNIT